MNVKPVEKKMKKENKLNILDVQLLLSDFCYDISIIISHSTSNISSSNNVTEKKVW